MSVDSAVPAASPRVQSLLAALTLEEKVAQLVSYWLDQPDDGVAPLQEDMVSADEYTRVSEHGLGHLTRVYGTIPVDPVDRARWLWGEQERIRAASGHGIGAVVHEECLTGLAAWQATTFPTPLAWGASFDPELVEEMAARIGQDMRALGVHQGLAPVLDVIRDPRWGRTEEAIAEDPYLVGTIGTAYVRGLQGSGVDATLKHFLGYSASASGRNHGPVHAGPRELRDILLPPFEMALRDGHARSVMNSYTDIDGVPVAADPHILTDLLRGELEFDGPVVADYYAVAFLELMHRVAADREDAASQALTAGIDVELPTADVYPLLVEAVRRGALPEHLVDRAVVRVLTQKERLGLLDPGTDLPPETIDLDSAPNRQVARQLAAESLVLVANNGILPLTAPGRIALIGPNSDSHEPLMGCYSFTNHVLAHHPEVDPHLRIPTLREALSERFPGARLEVAEGCPPEGDSPAITAQIEAAAELAREADVIVAAVGDRSGLFGRGTVGEGNDVHSLNLPGRQRDLVEALVRTGKPVVLVLLTGRPYALDWALAGSDGELPESAPAAVVQAFFPGEEGAPAIADLLAGVINPSGRLPVSLPRAAGAQPYTYLHPVLGGPTGVSAVDPTPVRPFGFGLSYSEFTHTDLRVPAQVQAGAPFTAQVTVTNVSARDGVDVVQLYGQDLVASVTRPVAQLLAYQRVEVPAGQSRTVTFTVPATRLAFTGRDLQRIVEPGTVDLWVGSDCTRRETEAQIELTGEVYRVTGADPRLATAAVSEGEL
ncbi:glycoside hydrolase family 3 N-terminal domain-containing protein [Actinomyces sp. F1_1611]